MNTVNPPAQPVDVIFHKTFFSDIYENEIGYNIYLPPDYDRSNGGHFILR